MTYVIESYIFCEKIKFFMVNCNDSMEDIDLKVFGKTDCLSFANISIYLDMAKGTVIVKNFWLFQPKYV